MSRWPSEHLLITLFPARVIAAKIKKGLRTRVVDRRVVETANLNPAPPWKIAVAALDKMLPGFAAPGVPATVIVSSRFVRYLIVPWRDDIIGAQEQMALARHCFKNIYGAAAADWEIKVSNDGFRRNAVASAVDAQLLRAIEKVLLERDISIASIQPHFMTACNRFRRQMKGYDSGCIAVLEPGRIAFGTFAEAGWCTLTTRRVASLKPEALVPVLAQELKVLSPGTLPEYLFVAAVGPTTGSFFRTRTSAWMLPAQTRVPGLVP